MLNETNRKKLDTIVQEMTINNEPESTIQFVVDDFKKKYAEPDVPQNNDGQVEQPEKGLLQNLKETGSNLIKNYKGILNRTINGQDPVSTGVQAVGATIGAATKAVSDIATPIAKPILETDLKIAKGAYNLLAPGYVKDLVSSEIIPKLSALGVKSVDDWKDFEQKHPTIANDISGAINIASIFPIGKATEMGGVAAKEALNIAKEGMMKQSAEKSTLKMADYVSSRLTPESKVEAYRAGKLIDATKIKSEKYIPDQLDTERAQIAKDIGIEGKNFSQDIDTAKNAIKAEADGLKTTLKNSGILWNRNQIVSELRKAKESPTLKLSLKGKDDKELYDEAILQFDKILQTKKGGTLDELLSARQEFDDLALKADKNIWSKKDGGLYNAVKNARDTINGYINEKIGDEIVKNSLRKQSFTYDILENLSEKAAKGETKLKPSQVKEFLNKHGRTILTGGVLGSGGYLGVREIIK